MSSTPDGDDLPLKLSLRPETEPERRGDRLVVPTELIPTLTPDQVSNVIEVAKAQQAFDHEYRMADKKAEAGTNAFASLMVVIVTLTACVVAGIAASHDQWVLLEKVAVPLATGIAGFMGGAGWQAKKATK